MPKVQVDKLKAGMVLAKDVLDKRGRMMLPLGASIAAGHMRTFKMLDIKFVFVVGDGDEDGGEEDEDWELSDGSEQKLRERFRLTDLGHPAVAEIFRFRSRQVARQEARDAKANQ